MRWDLHVLVVEDNPADARLSRDILQEISADIGVMVAETLSAAIAILELESFDVILLDLGLPDSKGVDTLASLKAHRSDLPFIVMTGMADEQIGIDAVRLGAQDYLIKGRVQADQLRRSLLYAIERKKADNALMEKEQFFENLTELNPAFITITDLKSNQAVFTGGRGLALPGFQSEAREGMAGFVPSMFYPGDFDKMTASASAVSRAGGDRIGDVEVRVKDAEGTWRWLRILSVVFKRDRKGTPLQLMTVVRDIHGLKSAEQELQLRTEELESMNQGLEAFSYAVAHDLRAPLRHIHECAGLLTKELGSGLNESARRHLKSICDGAKHMEELFDDLLSLSHVGCTELQKQTCGLNTLVKEAMGDLEPELAGREIEWRMGELPWIDCDPALMRQVMANLLSNAVKFSMGRHPAIIEVGLTAKEGEPAIFVRDNGVGFNMEHADKLFTLFARLHRQEDFKGSGVGLAIVQRILQRHGGRAWAAAELNKGATFYFTLPALAAADRPQNTVPPAELVTASQAGPGVRVG